MNLYLRLIIAILVSRLRPQANTSLRLDSQFRVWPHDLDAFGHMNNGRYLQIMDVARTAWMGRCGALSAMVTNNWGAVLGGGTVRFRKSLKVFQKYRVTTRLVCWDSRWFYLEHGFIDSKNRCVAVGVSRAALQSRKGWVTTKEDMAVVDPDAIAPPIPQYLKDMTKLEDEMQRQFTAAQDTFHEYSATEVAQLVKAGKSS